MSVIRGRFGDTSGRPYLEATVIMPRLGIQGEVSFIIDTGADDCMLMPTDSDRLGIPFDKLQGDQECGGIGGTVHCFLEKAIVVFTDGKQLYAYSVEMSIYQRDPSMADCPSLLGRDILDRWKMTYDPSSDYLGFIPRTWDALLAVP